MNNYDGVKAAEYLFETCFSSLRADAVEVEIRFTDYNSAANTSLMTIRVLGNRGQILSQIAETIQVEEEVINEIICFEQQNNPAIAFVIRIENHQTPTGFQEVWGLHMEDPELRSNSAVKEFVEHIQGRGKSVRIWLR